MSIEFTEKYLDVSDLRARLAELAGEPGGSAEDAEREAIREALDDIGTCAGSTLIHDEAFQDYIRDTCYDVGDIARDSWLDSFVDWEKVAHAAKLDYRAIVVQDESGDTFAMYWVRI